MYQYPIGVILESFRKPIPEAVKAASALGLDSIQVYATKHTIAGVEMSASDRKEFLKMVKDNGLRISAICGDLGKGFGNPELNSALVEESKQILDIALEMETNIVTTHIGVVPASASNPRYGIMQKACRELAEYAKGLHAHFAVETGPEPAEVLKHFLDSLGSDGVAVNMDPANLVMIVHDDPVKAVYTLRDYIVHTHAKDGRQLHPCDAEVIYGIRPRDPSYNFREEFIELPLGKGDVPFNAYLHALDEIGYRGCLTIERETGEQPEQDISAAVHFLHTLLH